MELLCIETEFEPTASFDAAIVDDDRILQNLIITEERYLIAGSYFKCLQTDLKANMRDIVANWMLEVWHLLMSRIIAVLLLNYFIYFPYSFVCCNISILYIFISGHFSFLDFRVIHM